MKVKKIVIAPDSFKETLSAKQVASEIAQVFAVLMPHVETVQVPMADGGEGTLEALVDATGGCFYSP
jgi:glycerate 2-kinase